VSAAPTREARVRVALGLASLVLVAAVAACGPPPGGRVHVGPLPTRLRSWEMARDLVIEPNISNAALSKGGAGWDPESAALTEPGTVVLFAHRVSHGGPFRTLDHLQAGNVLTLNGTDARTYTYVVVGIAITAPSWAAVLAWQPSTGYGLSLVACHPPGSVSHRIVVHAELVGISS
jgi:LPXTG-site transpeptidase (sortase) family protein